MDRYRVTPPALLQHDQPRIPAARLTTAAVHHTQPLNCLVRDKKLIPVTPVAQIVTYHDLRFPGQYGC